MDRAFSPRIYHLRPISWGGTPGWYQAAPLALGTGGESRMDADGREWGRRWRSGVDRSVGGAHRVERALTDLPRQGAGMFPAAPTAHNENAQASGLGIGDNIGTGGLKARHIRRVPNEPDDAGPSALESFQCPISWGGTPGWYQAAPLALGSGMANGPVCSRIKGLVRSRFMRPAQPGPGASVCLMANGPAPSQPMASP